MKIITMITLNKFVTNDIVKEELFGSPENDILLVLDDNKGDVVVEKDFMTEVGDG